MVEWLGITTNKKIVSQLGLDEKKLQQKLHVLRADGEIVTGTTAFTVIWSSLKFYRLLAILVHKFKLIPVLDYFYHHFARWRFAKQIKNCRINVK